MSLSFTLKMLKPTIGSWIKPEPVFSISIGGSIYGFFSTADKKVDALLKNVLH